MTQTNSTADDWTPIPPGSLLALASRLKTRRQMRLVGRVGVVAGVVVAAIGLSLFSMSPTSSMQEPNFGGITCTEVHRVMPDVIADRANPDVLRRVQDHVRQCAACQKLMQNMQTAPRETASVDRANARHWQPHQQGPRPRQSRPSLEVALANGSFSP